MKFHFYKIEIPDKYLYRLLNNAKKTEIRKIRIHNNIISFEVDYKNKTKILEILDKHNINIINITEFGVLKKIINFSVVKIVSIITMIFCAIIFICSCFVWKITIDGNYTYTDEQISKFINEQNINEGTLIKDINIDDLEKKIRKKFNEISWVCVEVKGTNLLVHIKENYITEISLKEDKPYDIVANKDCLIKSILVRSGKAMVKAGEQAKKGDVLISGVIDVNDESGQKIYTNFYNADGDIVGENIYEFTEKLNEIYEKKIVVDTKYFTLPSFWGRKWLLKNTSKSEVYCEEKKIRLIGDFYLPISLCKYRVTKHKKTKQKYTKENAEKILNNNFLYKLSILEQKGYKILKKDVKIDKINDVYVLVGNITCNEPIGEVSYINQNDYIQSEEGTTYINERN